MKLGVGMILFDFGLWHPESLLLGSCYCVGTDARSKLGIESMEYEVLATCAGNKRKIRRDEEEQTLNLAAKAYLVVQVGLSMPRTNWLGTCRKNHKSNTLQTL